ncbi:MAG: glycosyltransferase [Pseudomonadota bacterium]
MRLTLLSPDFRTGGAERAVAIMANHWCAQGHQVTILTMDDGSFSSLFSLAPGIRHHALGIFFPSSGLISSLRNEWTRLRRIRARILKSRPDAVVSVIDSVNIRTIMATRFTGLPVLVSERTDPAHHDIGPFWSLARNLTYPLADAVITQTETAKNHFRRAIRNKTLVIPNPVVAPGMNTSPYRESKNIVCLTRLSPEKDPFTMLKAFARIAHQHPEWTLTFVGDGSEADTLMAETMRQNLQARVIFAGWQRNVGRWLRCGAIIALSSRYEGFPNALCEGLAHGLPAVATATTGAASVVRPGVDGLLVEVGDDEAFAKALARLIEDADLRQTMGARAAEILDRFGVDRVMGSWNTHLSHLIAKRRGHAPAE